MLTLSKGWPAFLLHSSLINFPFKRRHSGGRQQKFGLLWFVVASGHYAGSLGLRGFPETIPLAIATDLPFE
jgi:hypothetical protein